MCDGTQSLPSTMDAASALAHDGAPHGVVVVADEQTSGRGRRGTTWASPPGAGLYFSFVARPDQASMQSLPLLTLAAGVAVREGIAVATGLAADLKWPNDLIVGRRKLAGILAEGVAIGTPDQAVISASASTCSRLPIRRTWPRARRRSKASSEGRSIAACCCRSYCSPSADRLAGLDQTPGDILQAWRAASPNCERHARRVGRQARHDGRHRRERRVAREDQRRRRANHRRRTALAPRPLGT